MTATRRTSMRGCPARSLRTCGYPTRVSLLKIADVARLLGVSDDTVRRWVDAGRLPRTTDDTGHAAVDGAEVARFAQTLADAEAPGPVVQASARNRFQGIVTNVVR